MRLGELNGMLSVSQDGESQNLNTRSQTLPPSSGIEDLREKREEINEQITLEEDEKSKVQSDLTVLSKRLTTLNDSIARKVRTEPSSSFSPLARAQRPQLTPSVSRLVHRHRPPRGTTMIRRFRRRRQLT